MAYDDLFRLSSHAVICNDEGQVLLIRASYGARSWGLPGGALEPSETVHEALKRECREELGCDVEVRYLSGVYYHSAYHSQAFIFRCNLATGSRITLSEEHTEYRFFAIAELTYVQQRRVRECLAARSKTTPCCERAGFGQLSALISLNRQAIRLNQDENLPQTGALS